MSKKNKKHCTECDCEAEDKYYYTKYRVILQDEDSSAEFTKHNEDDTGNDSTWNEILLVFRNILIAKGYSWNEEKEGLWRELINSGLDGDVY